MSEIISGFSSDPQIARIGAGKLASRAHFAFAPFCPSSFRSPGLSDAILAFPERVLPSTGNFSFLS
jgi:hypothetical protein